MGFSITQAPCANYRMFIRVTHCQGANKPRLLREEFLNLFDDFDEHIHFRFRVVEIETGSRRGFHAQLVHQRLRAMMPAPQRHAALVRERHDIVRMHIFQEKTDQASAIIFRAKDTDVFQRG